MKKYFFVALLLLASTQIEADESAPVFMLQKVDPQKILESSPGADPASVNSVYTCHTAHFPPGSEYSFYVKKLGQDHVKVCTCQANSAGELVRFNFNENGTQPLSDFLLMLNGFKPGEPIEYFVVSVDHQDVRAVKVIPNPIENCDHEGRKISLELLSPDKRLYALHLTHFHPNEVVISRSESGSDIVTNRLTVSEEGRLRGIVHCVEENQGKGTSSITITPDGSEIPLQVVYEWGVAES